MMNKNHEHIENKAEALRKWIHSNGYRNVYSSMLLQYSPRAAGRKSADVSAVMNHLCRTGRVEKIAGGAHFDGAHRKKAWKILDLIATPFDETDNVSKSEDELHNHDPVKQKERDSGHFQSGFQKTDTTCQEQCIDLISDGDENWLEPADKFPGARPGLWDVPF